MVDTEKRKGGGKLARSETVTVRLDPKLRYLAELAARKQRRSLSSYIEWAVEDSLARVLLHEDMNSRTSVADESITLWDVDEADRFAKLAFAHPDLMTHDEQVRWKLIRENGALWRGRYNGPQEEFTWTPIEEDLVLENLRRHWSVLCDVASGALGKESLPPWAKTKAKLPTGYGPPKPTPRLAPKTGFDAMDDDIPF